MARLHRELMHTLLEDIISGRYQPGTMLPKEEDLRDRLGVSRGVVRELVRALEERGVVAVKHGRGATIAPEQTWNLLDGDVLQALLPARRARPLLDQLLEARRIVEVQAARLAAERRTDAQLDELQATLERMETSSRSGRTERAAAEVEFHRVLCEATGNRPLTQMLSPLLDAIAATLDNRGHRAGTRDEHREILEALVRRDPDAAANTMREHLQAVSARLKGAPARRARA